MVCVELKVIRILQHLHFHHLFSGSIDYMMYVGRCCDDMQTLEKFV